MSDAGKQQTRTQERPQTKGQGAVADAKPAQLPATKQPSEFEVELEQYEPQIAAALPAHIPVERFKRTILTAINQNPDLYRADRRTLFLSCVRCAQDGLLPDGREAALVIFNTKMKRHGAEQWVKAVQYMPMVAGIIKRMRNSGEVSAVDTQLVHENDVFDYQLGDEPKIVHRPVMADRGEALGAYAIIKLSNGEVLREVMTRQEIERVRAVSKSKDKGPWVDWWGEMARKTVLRRCSKRAPVSSDLDQVLRSDDEAAVALQYNTDSALPKLEKPRDTRTQMDQFAGLPAGEADENAGPEFDEDGVIIEQDAAAGPPTRGGSAPATGASSQPDDAGAQERSEADEAPARDAAFWTGSLAIDVGKIAGGSAPDWDAWSAAMIGRVGEAESAAEIASLDEANKKAWTRLKAYSPAKHDKIRGEFSGASNERFDQLVGAEE